VSKHDDGFVADEDGFVADEAPKPFSDKLVSAVSPTGVRVQVLESELPNLHGFTSDAAGDSANVEFGHAPKYKYVPDAVNTLHEGHGLEDTAQGVVAGLTANNADELTGAVSAPEKMSGITEDGIRMPVIDNKTGLARYAERFKTARDKVRNAEDVSAKRSPLLYPAGELVGGAAPIAATGGLTSAPARIAAQGALGVARGTGGASEMADVPAAAAVEGTLGLAGGATGEALSGLSKYAKLKSLSQRGKATGMSPADASEITNNAAADLNSTGVPTTKNVGEITDPYAAIGRTVEEHKLHKPWYTPKGAAGYNKAAQDAIEKLPTHAQVESSTFNDPSNQAAVDFKAKLARAHEKAFAETPVVPEVTYKPMTDEEHAAQMAADYNESHPQSSYSPVLSHEVSPVTAPPVQRPINSGMKDNIGGMDSDAANRAIDNLIANAKKNNSFGELNSIGGNVPAGTDIDASIKSTQPVPKGMPSVGPIDPSSQEAADAIKAAGKPPSPNVMKALAYTEKQPGSSLRDNGPKQSTDAVYNSLAAEYAGPRSVGETGISEGTIGDLADYANRMTDTPPSALDRISQGSRDMLNDHRENLRSSPLPNDSTPWDSLQLNTTGFGGAVQENATSAFPQSEPVPPALQSNAPPLRANPHAPEPTQSHGGNAQAKPDVFGDAVRHAKPETPNVLDDSSNTLKGPAQYQQSAYPAQPSQKFNPPGNPRHVMGVAEQHPVEASFNKAHIANDANMSDLQRVKDMSDQYMKEHPNHSEPIEVAKKALVHGAIGGAVLPGIGHVGGAGLGVGHALSQGIDNTVVHDVAASALKGVSHAATGVGKAAQVAPAVGADKRSKGVDPRVLEALLKHVSGSGNTGPRIRLTK
jgi:hypothetical protein